MLVELIVVRLATSALDVVALVVEASRVVICPLVAKRLVRERVKAFNRLAKSVPPTFKLVIEDVAATS